MAAPKTVRLRAISDDEATAKRVLNEWKILYGDYLQNVSGPNGGRRGEWLVYALLIIPEGNGDKS